MRILIAFILPALLVACAIPDGDGGKTRASVETLKFDEAGRVIQKCSATLIDGKDRENTSFTGEICGGFVHYEADKSVGSTGQAIEAEVAKALNETMGKSLPEMTAAVTRGVLGVTALGSVGTVVSAKGALEAARIKAESLKAAAQAKPVGPVPSGAPR